MKTLKRIIIIFFSVCMFSSIFCNYSFAAGKGSIKITSNTGQVGSNVTIKGTISSSSGPLAAAKVVMTFNPKGVRYVSGSGGTFNPDNVAGSVQYGVMGSGTETSFSFSITFNVLQEGSWGIAIKSYQVVDLENAEELTISATSGTITGKAPTTTPSNPSNNNQPQNNKDTNNKLSALQVYPGTLSPAFNSDTTSYTVDVPGNTTEVTISATPASGKATVSVSGGKDLKLGANEAKVIVVAESGASRAYTITIMCGEAEKIQIDGTEHTINENFADEQIPTGFSRKQVTYNNRQYEAVTNANSSLTLMSLQSGETASFYIYNQETQEFYDFVQIQLSEGKYIIPLPLNEEVEEFESYDKTTFQVQGKNIEAWKLDHEFSIAYVMNQDGTEVLYKYDSVDGTFQRYNDIKVEDVEQAPVQKTWFPNVYYMYAIVGLGILSLILLITMIYFIASRKIRHEGRKKKAIRRQEKQREKEERLREKEEYKREKEERERQEHQRILEEEREKQRQKEEKKMARKKKKENE